MGVTSLRQRAVTPFDNAPGRRRYVRRGDLSRLAVRQQRPESRCMPVRRRADRICERTVEHSYQGNVERSRNVWERARVLRTERHRGMLQPACFISLALPAGCAAGASATAKRLPSHLLSSVRVLSMQRSKRSRKRPGKIRINRLVTVGLPSETMKALERWAKRGKITRAEAIRRLLNSALAASTAAAKL